MMILRRHYNVNQVRIIVCKRFKTQRSFSLSFTLSEGFSYEKITSSVVNFSFPQEAVSNLTSVKTRTIFRHLKKVK